MSMFRHVTGKFKGMRKEYQFTVYPVEAGSDKRTIQGDRYIAKVDLSTGKAILSKGVNNPVFMHLQPIMGAKLVDCPQTIIDQLKALDEDHGEQSEFVVPMDGASVEARAEPAGVSIFDL